MSAKPDAESPPAKSKKLLVIVAVLVVVLVAAAGGAWVFISKQRAAAAEADGEAPAKTAVKPGTPPTFLPLENMVVNLADASGDKVAQVGVTLEVVDAHASDKVKAYLPAVRSGILLLVSQRTAPELLSREGKDKLAHDILVEAAKPFGGLEEEEEEKPAEKEKAGAKAKKKKPKKAAHGEVPVRAVLFSSFIVQ